MRNNNSIMEFSTHRRSLYWLLGLCLLLFETASTDAQGKRASRIANPRSFGSSVKTATSNGLNFDCPEEFGYYPHPSDCTQYYVCVFGGALLESCTGGLMYSHELQTCDWPRNVGCELVDSGTSATSTELGSASRSKVQQQQKHQQQQHQHVPSRIRFGSAFTSPSAIQKAATVSPQYNRSPPQSIQAQVEHIPPPPELRVPPNPVVMSRGQPKSLLESQEEIAKLYAEAHETLPPVEEEESDRQQRVYRGQPSTVSQVQRDRDGIIHQASINAIPSHGKIGSYTFGTAYSESNDDDIPVGLELSHNRLNLDKRRKRRDVNGVKLPTTLFSPERINTLTKRNSDSKYSSKAMENASDESMNTFNNSKEELEEPASTASLPHKYSCKVSQKDLRNSSEDDEDCIELNDDIGDNTAGESMRRPRQLRPFPYTSPKWAGQNFRSIDTPSSVHHLNTQKNGYSFGNYNPYLTPSVQQNLNNQNYNQLSPIPTYKPYIQQHIHQQQQPTFAYTGYNLSLPPLRVEDDFRPITGNYYGAASLTSPRPQVNYQDQKSPGDLLPYIIQQLKAVKERRKQIQTENFAYFHLDNQPIPPLTTPRSPFDHYSTSKPIQQVTPNGNNVQHSTMGGFYNNKPDHASGKLISQYSIVQGPESLGTTESNYFQYNIITNQKMKGTYNTAKQNQIDHANKVRPPVTPVHVTPNFNIISAPNLAINKPGNLQQIPLRDLSQLPVGISYASNNTLPESFQTFTKSISSTAVPKLPSTTTKQQEPTDFQFNINEFMANLKASDLASFNPAVNPLIKYFKQVSNDPSGNIRNSLVLRRPVNYTSTTTTTVRPALRTKPIPANQPTTTSTTRVPKGYEDFVKTIQSKNSTGIPRLTNGYTSTTTTDKSVEYYDDEYDDGVDEDMLPPSRMPPYMPMSETMSPPRPHITTSRPTTAKASSMRPYTQTGFMAATTTRRPFSNFAQLKQSNQGSSVPAFISFPSDIFQELRQRLPQLKASAVTNNPTIHVRVQSTTTMKTTSPPESTRFTARPQRTRGQHKWQTQVMDNLHPGSDRPLNETNRGSKSSVSADGLGGLHLNSIHINSSAERQRVESSSPSSQLVQTSDNIFVPPSSSAPPPQLPSNRNYYNASIYNHGVGYQTQQQAQIQQQPTPFQQPQQQQQQQEATALPNPYDSSYYSVYDDDVDLYRDIEYQQQQQQQQHQHQLQQEQQQQQEYQSNIRQQQQHTTYRPLEILTTPQPVHRPTYNAQPVLSYSTDYDEDLNAQIEHDNVYEQPTPTPRREEVTIQTLEGQIAATTTLKPSARLDMRNYYNTLPTPNGSSEETDYTYSASSEDYYETEGTPGKNNIKTEPKPVNLNEFNRNENDVVQSSTPNKVGQYEKHASTTSRTTTSPTRLSSATSKYTTKATTTTTTQSITPPTKLPLLSSKTHVNKNFKQNVVIKLKTTTKIPRPTQAPSTTTASSTTSTPIPPLVPTFNSNPFLKSKLQVLAKSLVQAVSLRESQSHVEIGNNERTKTSEIQVHHTPSPLLPSTSEHWSLVDDSANRSSPSVETIYDESQTVHIQALEIPSTHLTLPSSSGKFLDFINAAAYGINNFQSTSTEKFQHEDNKYDGIKKEPLSSTEKSQRIQSYVESDVKPQSFKATTVSRHMLGTDSEESLDSSSTTRPNNVYHYSLQSGSHGFTLKAQQSLKMDNASEPLIQRVDTWHQVKPNTTTTTTTQKTTRSPYTQVSTNAEEYENILPTTYAPLRVWRNGRPTIKQPAKLTTAPTFVTELARDVNSFTTRASIVISNLTTSTERAIPSQTFTARATLFKDNLSRVTSNPSVRFVSPYKSLESLLQDERDRGSHNNLRASARSRYASGLVSPPFLQTTPKSIKNVVPIGTLQKNISHSVFATMGTGSVRNFSISDAILSTFNPQKTVESTTTRTTTTSSSTSISGMASTIITTESVPTTNILQPTVSTIVTTSPIHVSDIPPRPRGRSRYTAATINYNLDEVNEPTTYAPKFKVPNNFDVKTTTFSPYPRRKMHRGRVANGIRQTLSGSQTNSRKKYNDYKEPQQPKETNVFLQKLAINTQTSNPIENEASIVELEHKPRAEALVAQHPLQAKQDNSIELNFSTETSASSSSEMIITDRPPVKYLYSNKYRQQTAEHTLAESLQNAGYIKSGNDRSRFQAPNVLEQLQHFLSASDSDESGSPQFVDEFLAPEVKTVVNEIKQIHIPTNRNATVPTTKDSTTSTTTTPVLLPTNPAHSIPRPKGNSSKFDSHFPILSVLGTDPKIQKNISLDNSTTTPITTLSSPSVATSPLFVPPTTRVSRVNNALKSSIAAAVVQSSSPGSTTSTPTYHIPGGRAKQFQYGFASKNNNNNQHQFNNNNAAVSAASVKCSDSTLNAKCNEIPSRNNNRNRGNTIYTNQDRDLVSTSNRGTHPPRSRPTLKPSGTIVSKAQEFVDIYKYPPSRPEPLYPQPTPDKTAAKCRKDVCLLPDCYCGGKDIPGELPVESIPQIVLLTFDDSVNDLNKQLYTDLFEKGRVNPNGCPITATFYVSHEWTDYSQVQNLYADGHEMASHTVSHSFGEQFSQKKWTREIAGQREILAAYGGVKLSDVRGMRAPFLSVGGNKMYKMLYDSNFTYDSSMPVYENRPPSWPYTLDYKIFHDCMIPPCPTRSYPGVWQVPMVMWQDLNGGRCSMGDACSNPSDADGVTKMIMKNFERHYTTNRAPFGLFYHAAWFTQPHHKEGFIKFLDAINAMQDVWIITNWQALQWVRDPTPTSRINSFQPFQCDYSDRPKRCNNPKVCNLWHKSGVRYMKTCQPCPDIYPWTGKSGIRSSRIDNEVEEPQT